MAFTTATPEKDVREIAGATPSGTKLVRVDGHSAVGKSRLAKAMASQLGWIRIGLDDYVDKKGRESSFRRSSARSFTSTSATRSNEARS